MLSLPTRVLLSILYSNRNRSTFSRYYSLALVEYAANFHHD